jgi:hypothetical protein
LYSELPRESQWPSTATWTLVHFFRSVGVFLQWCPRVGAQFRLVEVEVHVVERALRVQLIQCLRWKICSSVRAKVPPLVLAAGAAAVPAAQA